MTSDVSLSTLPYLGNDGVFQVKGINYIKSVFMNDWLLCRGKGRKIVSKGSLFPGRGKWGRGVSGSASLSAHLLSLFHSLQTCSLV